MCVICTASRDERRDLARELSERLGLPRCRATDAAEGLRLIVTDERLELGDAQTRPGRGLHVDLIEPLHRAGGTHIGRKQPLGRAIGERCRTVVDATAGFGRDALLLAMLGYDVLMIERHPVLAVMLDEALRQARDDPAFAERIGERLRPCEGDAREVLPGIDPPPDAVYLDPMHPPKRKRSALPKKSMVLTRALVGDDLDAAELLSAARAVAQQRVVVKMPDNAAPLADDPVSQHGGKLVRYDVYRPVEAAAR